MSGLVSSGIAWAFYNNAQSEDIEYKSSAFWQVILQTWFKLEDNYAVICEYSPDGGRSRTDISVFKYDPNHHTLAILNVIEAKRQGNAPKQAEKDALESALKAIDEYKMTGIYAMTIWGTKFRLWMVAAERRKLEPVDEGEDQLGHRASYIDAASDQARCFVDAVNLMKDEPALRRAPILPSQTHLLNQVSSQFIYGSTQIQTDQAGVGPAYPQVGADTTFIPQVGDASGSAGQTGSVTKHKPAHATREKTVKLTRVRHLTTRDELMFKRGNSQQSTLESEWNWDRERNMYKWNRSKETTYYTESLEK
ncbi:hypothetical protein ACQRIT_000046 [Beauveria bassiana]